MFPSEAREEVNLSAIGKVLLMVGGVFVLVGLVLMLKDKIPWIGRLPGDIHVKRDTFSFYFPLTTCIIISVILTFLFAFFRK
ncbi:MAG: DUF2905 family protein [Proteobacteria bacterium]|nr:DUF2905 family protein [Pseudomonadota bacterium]